MVQIQQQFLESSKIINFQRKKIPCFPWDGSYPWQLESNRVVREIFYRCKYLRNLYFTTRPSFLFSVPRPAVAPLYSKKIIPVRSGEGGKLAGCVFNLPLLVPQIYRVIPALWL